MKLSLDDAPVKEHVAALSRDLGEDIIVSEAMCRKSTKKQHIGTSMNDIGGYFLAHRSHLSILLMVQTNVEFRPKAKFMWGGRCSGNQNWLM